MPNIAWSAAWRYADPETQVHLLLVQMKGRWTRGYLLARRGPYSRLLAKYRGARQIERARQVLESIAETDKDMLGDLDQLFYNVLLACIEERTVNFRRIYGELDRCRRRKRGEIGRLLAHGTERRRETRGRA